MYQLTYSALAERAIEKLERSTQRRVLGAAAKLATDPRPPGAIKMIGQDKYRIRVGDYRVIFPSMTVN